MSIEGKIGRSLLVDTSGKPLTQGLFLEIGYSDSSIYTLKDSDHQYGEKTLPSIKRLYLEMRGADVGMSIVGVLVRFGSTLSAQALKASGCPSTAVDISGSRADVTSMISAGSGIGIRARFNSSVNALNANITASTSFGMFADAVSTINGYGAQVKSSATKDLRVNSGSFIAATTMQTTNSTVAVPIVGDTTVAAFNTLTAAGAIFVN